ncbi:MAG TPA: hypothetical protein DCQ92_16355 [Verrucomicrobia subdivision 3 bacterium]|nr:hypothetical protein [Limisphaerales bacterium]
MQVGCQRILHDSFCGHSADQQNPNANPKNSIIQTATKVALNPNETKTVQFKLTPRDLAYFDVAGH